MVGGVFFIQPQQKVFFTPPGVQEFSGDPINDQSVIDGFLGSRFRSLTLIIRDKQDHGNDRKNRKRS